jgi:hypothetical protein
VIELRSYGSAFRRLRLTCPHTPTLCLQWQFVVLRESPAQASLGGAFLLARIGDNGLRFRPERDGYYRLAY